MPLLPPSNDKEVQPVVLFPNQGQGMGWGVTSATGEELPEGYDHTVNMRCVGGRILSPSFAATVRQYLVGKKPPTEMVPWVASATDDTPILVILHDTGVKIFTNGALSAETDATTAEYGGAAFYDDGTNPILVAGTTTGSKFLNKRSIAGSWTAAASASRTGTVVTEAAGAFYAAKNTYQVGKWAAGSDPTQSDPGSTIRVGTIDAAINSIGAIDGKVIVGKEDGIWAYSESASRFENIYRVPKHPGNFKRMRPDGQGGLLTMEDTGDVIHLHRFGSIIAYNILRNKAPWRDTPHGPFTDVVAHGDKVIALMDGGYRMTQSPDVIMAVTTDAVEWTVYDTAVTDQRNDTTADLSAFSTAANNDYIIIGASVPFLMIDWRLGTANSAASRLRVARVSGNFSGAPTNIPYALSTIFNGTDTTPGTTATPFAQDGRIALLPDNPDSAEELTTPGVGVPVWAEMTATLNGVAYTRYWMALYLE